MKKRISKIIRKTNETNVGIQLNLDGSGKFNIDTGIGFLDHMLELFSKQSLIDLKIEATGDLVTDEHHTVEDVAITLGRALKEALGDKKGIERYGSKLLPMDEALVECAVDLGGRSYLVWNITFYREKIGDMSTELLEDFFKALSDNLSANIHVNLRYGRNNHHIAEGMFKAFARAMRMAIKIDPAMKNSLPSTKGIL
ncbi:MAG: imidazoleglycerol-phosphate dehydratase HisB [Candidatus Paceibacterota bacterium]